MRYKTENEIADVVRSFEDATITREGWKHAEHLTLALHYLTLYDYETATERMRSGIFKLLGAFGVDLEKEMPYHETLTVFWMKTVEDFNNKNAGVPLLERANKLIEDHDKDFPLRYYSSEYLFSDIARANFVAGDL